MKESEKKRLSSNIWKYYLFEIFTSLVFFLPIIVLFWQENGLSMTEIMLLQSIFAIAIVLLEIPTGYFADIFGRKTSLICSAFFGFFGILSYSLGNSFYHFLVAEILLAFGNSFASGADSALVYDTLKELKQEERFKKIWGHAVFLGLVSIAFSNIIGGFIGEVNFRWTFFTLLPALALSFLIAVSMYEPKRTKLIFERGHMHELFKIIKHVFAENKKLRWLLIYAGIAYAFNQASLWFYQPYFSLSGLNIVHFGFIFASFQLSLYGLRCD